MLEKILNLFKKKKEEKITTIEIYDDRDDKKIMEINNNSIELNIEQVLKLRDIDRLNKEVEEEEIRNYKIERLEKFMESQVNAISHKVVEGMLKPITEILETKKEQLELMKKTNIEIQEIKKDIKELKEIISENKNSQKTITETSKTEMTEIEETELIVEEEKNDEKPITTEKPESITTTEKQQQIITKISYILNRELSQITKTKEKTLSKTFIKTLENIKNSNTTINKIEITNIFNLTEEDIEELNSISETTLKNEYKKNLQKITQILIEKIKEFEKTPSVKVDPINIKKSQNKNEIMKMSYVSLLEHIASMIILAIKNEKNITENKTQLIIIGSIIHDIGKTETTTNNHKNSIILEEIEENNIIDKIFKNFLKEIIEKHDIINPKEKLTKTIKIADKISRITEQKLMRNNINQPLNQIFKEKDKIKSIKEIESLIEKIEKGKDQNIIQNLIKITADIESIEKAIMLANLIYEKENKSEIIKEKIKQLKKQIKEYIK